MNVRGDVVVLWQMLRGQPRHGSQQERLQRFYAPQAAHYDAFRERLLHGRRELIERLSLAPGQRVVELGCGTGRNLDFVPPALRAQLGHVDLVDLCPALVREARRRTQGAAGVTVVNADAALFEPDAPVDRVYLSYALSMMPDWRAVLRNAYRMLKPGGQIGVVDYYVPASAPNAAARLRDAFWRRWFAHDGVSLSPAQGAFLAGQFETVVRLEQRAALPYLPLARVPWYLFVGRK
jgi:S-adenosylmethionine-diacylgycerolhomoserine-N-methlytransferase